MPSPPLRVGTLRPPSVSEFGTSVPGYGPFALTLGDQAPVRPDESHLVSDGTIPIPIPIPIPTGHRVCIALVSLSLVKASTATGKVRGRGGYPRTVSETVPAA